jgi:hypothetical protein
MSKYVAATCLKYDEYSPLWKKVRDSVKGHDHIQSKGDEYLPKLSGQEDDSYAKYLKAALFYNATGRTYKAYKGMIFRKDPVVNLDVMEDFLDDCTLSGKSVPEFTQDVTSEELQVSRVGILVDHPPRPSERLSQADAERRGHRPYLVMFKAEDILKVKTDRIGNRTVLSMVRLRQHVEVPGEDEFDQRIEERIQVLDLDPDRNYIYRIRIFKKVNEDERKKDDSKTEYEEDTDLRRYPTMNGEYIKEIPFYMTGGYDFREPHLIDLANVNLSHYVAYADHRKGLSWTTRPQPTATGIRDTEIESLTMGGEEIWYSENSEAQFDMLEYSGSGLTASEKNLEKLEEQMATLGARMLMPEAQTAETATEFVIKKQGENSSLAEVSKLVSKALQAAIRFAARWSGVNDETIKDIDVEVNTDFLPVSATPDDLIKMIQAVQTGNYTQQDYIWWLNQNEMVDPTIDSTERQSQLQTNRPPGLTAGNNGAE